MYWDDVTSGGKAYSMAHLDPFNLSVPVGHRNIEVDVSFGFHVFTDEKGKGAPLWFKGEERYFCSQRWQDSQQIQPFLTQHLGTAYCRPFMGQKGGQMFYLFEITDYAMFLTIQKPSKTVNELKMRVISAYSVAPWGQQGLPTRAKAVKMGYVLDRKETGQTIPMK